MNIKKIFVFLTILFLYFNVFAQGPMKKRKLEKGLEAVSFYKDIEFVKSYQRGSTPNLYGFMKNDEYILPPLFNWNRKRNGIKQNKVILKLSTKAGIFNLDTYEWDIPLSYKSLLYLYDDLYLAESKGFSIVNSSNQVKFQFAWDFATDYKVNEKDFLIVRQSNKGGVYDFRNNKYIIPLKYSKVDLITDPIAFKVQNEYEEYNFFDLDGKMQNEKWYKEFSPVGVQTGLFRIKKNGRYGIISAEGKIIAPLEFQHIGFFPLKNEYILARKMSGEYGLIRVNGDIALPFVYDNIIFSGGRHAVIVVDLDGRYGVIKMKDGAPIVLIENECDFIKISNDLCFVEKDNRHGVVNFEGNIEIPLEHKAVERFDHLIIAKSDSTSTLYKINKGKTVLLASYDDVTTLAYSSPISQGRSPRYSEDHLLIKVDNKMGIIDKQGKVIIEPFFEEIVEISSRKYIVARLDGKYGVYNIETKSAVIDFIYDRLIHKRGLSFYGFRNKAIDVIEFSMNIDKIEVEKVFGTD